MPTRMRDISNEAVLLAGGARAILLQLAMPAVGTGVARHSDFTSDPLRRLRNTLTYLYVLVYGTPAEVAAIVGYVDRAHAPVRSEPDEHGTAYDAVDPQQQLWVAATLYDTAMRVRELVYGPLAPADAEVLLADYAIVGTALGVPRTLWPADLAAFAEYWNRALPREVDGVARDVARELLHPRSVPLWIRLAMPTVRMVTAGLLGPELREAYGLPLRERRFARAVHLGRVVYPRLPRAVREAPMRRYLRAFRASGATTASRSARS